MHNFHFISFTNNVQYYHSVCGNLLNINSPLNPKYPEKISGSCRVPFKVPFSGFWIRLQLKAEETTTDLRTAVR